MSFQEWKAVGWFYLVQFPKHMGIGFFIYLGVQGAKALLGV